MDHSARTADHTTAHAAPTVPDREQSTPTPCPGAELVFAEVARLANELCEHLADSQWHTAARVRELAETALSTAGER
ncbi:hypothetical protein [Streptomyces sp. NPDC051218]|uniref:hypothetical protein n=1 Tax=Streptomyces sp. NPDC051218 TaxID=3365645 RepID=UPI0037BD7559